MSRTRLAAAAGVAALTLGATAAAATNIQAVTITVEAADRSVTVAGDVGFTVDAGATLEAAVTDTSTISLANPAGNNEAKITVGRGTDGLGDLVLAIDSIAAPATTDDYTVVGTLPTWTADDGTTANAITGIKAGADESDRTITWKLTGTAPTTTTPITTNFTFTIADN
jgi:hypothetical protein